MFEKKVFITEYVGLSTRLETLAMAFLISEYYGHKVCIDWSELDSLNVVGATVESPGVFGRINTVKIRNYSDQLFYRLGEFRNVNLRTHQGPDHLLQKMYIPTAKRVKLRPDLIQVVRDTFLKVKGRPVVGVHIRRGDFNVFSEEEFDVNQIEWPAVPEWWYEHVMAQILKVHKDTAFFISCSGSSDAFPSLKKNFDLFELPTSFPYTYKGPSHSSNRHPSSDLFALACCNVIIGSPCSTFSHYAAHALGEPSICLIPPPKMKKSSPAFGKTCLYGRGAFDWYQTCREGRNLEMIQNPESLPEPREAVLNWM